ncbi:hypothetical protein AVEN_114889-1 [Araneus ventricosus]|uniref:Uncharacterized protein n=1 Tax=Araneus ventricosus TaxID=182803 RepID=A0A4Y2S935_ARAVE|nr:hypothetical protein AVEN_114889-1 [Araneus ventricosus]
MGPFFGNVQPIQLVSTPHIFVALGLVAISTLQQTVQQDMSGDIFWHFSCWAPGHSLSDNFIQARTDDRKTHCRELAGLLRDPHTPLDEIARPSQQHTEEKAQAVASLENLCFAIIASLRANSSRCRHLSGY